MPDAVLYLISQAYLSGRRFKRLAAGLEAATPISAVTVRMEGAGQSAMDALDALYARGARDILVQPVGIPFSDSLMAWLPGALAHWQRMAARDRVRLRLARDQIDDEAVLSRIVISALAAAEHTDPSQAETGSIDGKGWDEVPSHRHHLLVCTGPRCTYRRAGLLKDALYSELVKQGVARDCLIATTGCLFPCNKGPVVAHYPAGHWYRLDTEADLSRFVATVLVAGRSLPEMLIYKVAHHEHA